MRDMNYQNEASPLLFHIVLLRRCARNMCRRRHYGDLLVVRPTCDIVGIQSDVVTQMLLDLVQAKRLRLSAAVGAGIPWPKTMR